MFFFYRRSKTWKSNTTGISWQEQSYMWYVMRWWWCPLCTKPTHLVGFFSASSLKQQSPETHVTPLIHLYPDSKSTNLCSYSLCCMLSGETANIKFQGRIQDFKLGGGALKLIGASEARFENFGGISCEKSRFYAKKNHIFSNFKGGVPPSAPEFYSFYLTWSTTLEFIVIGAGLKIVICN